MLSAATGAQEPSVGKGTKIIATVGAKTNKALCPGNKKTYPPHAKPFEFQIQRPVSLWDLIQQNLTCQTVQTFSANNNTLKP